MSGGSNCYPGSDVLINNYNIRDKDLLDRLETQKVMANYDQKEYLEKIICDALNDVTNDITSYTVEGNISEEYKIAKKDYEAFRKKYSIRK